tara:strand:- start:6704 stop:7747 length:1044 start_codon:yes stop_codon:yes gene_type:complete
MATETTIVREAPFLEEQRQKLLESAETLTETPITLPKQELAPISDTTQQAYDLAQTGIGSYQPYLTAAGDQLASAEGITSGLADRGSGALDEARLAALAGAGDITPRIQAFQNPYQQQVMDAFTAEANRQAAIQRQRTADAAVRQGAFGGSGAALQQAELDRNLADVQQRNIANLLSQGYQQSLGAAEREAARMQALPGQLMGIEQLQYQLPQSVANQQMQQAQMQQGLGQLAQQLPAQDVALLSQIGAQQQQQAQRALDIERQNILQQTYEPYQRIGYMSDILKGQPSTTSTLSQSTDPRVNPLSQALGAGISLAGIFGPTGYGSGYLFGPGGAQLAGAAQSAMKG